MIDTEKLSRLLEERNIAVDGYAAQRLDLYAQRLVAWNEKMNLTGITDPDGILEKHFIDSIEPLRFVEIPRNARVIDVGTGAGFPGLPLLIARPDLDLTLADSLHKRLVFLKDVLHGCGLVAERVHERAEILGKDPDYRERYDIATARAVAPLPVLCEYCLPLVRVGGVFIAMKGPDADAELGGSAAALKKLGGAYGDTRAFTLPDGSERRLVVCKKISQTPTAYPRNGGKIAKKPL